jgi:hypothetical protein
MANPRPVHRFPAKYVDGNGSTCETERIRLPKYLLEEIRAIAHELHQQRVAEGTAGMIKGERKCTNN